MIVTKIMDLNLNDQFNMENIKSQSSVEKDQDGSKKVTVGREVESEY